MSYDPDVPTELKKTQGWFASVITQPLGKDDKIRPLSATGTPIEQEAEQFLNPSPTLKPYQRIQIYNQQYWWRLLSVLQDVYPMLLRFFGYEGFNREIAEPFLCQYIPNHWNINFIGDRLPQWIQEKYQKKDRTLVFDVACIDWAYSQSFTAKVMLPLDRSAVDMTNLETLLKTTLYLQPHAHLFAHKLNLFDCRQEFLKHDPDYWEQNSFPKVESDEMVYHILYRTHSNQVVFDKVSYPEFLLLDRFIKGDTIENACEWLVDQNQTMQEEASKNLSQWLQRFIISGWLAQK